MGDRLAEVAQSKRKLLVEEALLQSPALQEVKRARAALDKALELDPLKFPAGSKVADAFILLVSVFDDIAKGGEPALPTGMKQTTIGDAP